MNKLLSGRFWLSIITGIVFAYATWKNKIPPEAVAAIITLVFTAYFSKQRTNGGSSND